MPTSILSNGCGEGERDAGPRIRAFSTVPLVGGPEGNVLLSGSRYAACQKIVGPVRDGQFSLLLEDEEVALSLASSPVSPVKEGNGECLEETGASLAEVFPLGFSEIEILAPQPTGYRYPYPISYIVGFACTLEKLGPFEPNDEASDRASLPFSEAESLDSIKGNAEFYNEALRRSNVDRSM